MNLHSQNNSFFFNDEPKYLPLVENNVLYEQIGNMIPICPLLLIKASSSFPYDSLANELEKISQLKTINSIYKLEKKNPLESKFKIKKILIKRTVDKFQKYANKKLQIPTALLSSFVEESFFSLDTIQNKMPLLIKEQTCGGCIIKGQFWRSKIIKELPISIHYFLHVQGTSNTELKAYRIEDQSTTIEKLLKLESVYNPNNDFSLIDPRLIPRICLNDISHGDLSSYKSSIIWKESAQPIKQIVTSSCILGIRTNFTLQIFKIPKYLFQWNSSRWWKKIGKITPEPFNKYLATCLRENQTFSLLELKLSPNKYGDFAVLCSNMTLVEWITSENRLHSFDLSHLIQSSSNVNINEIKIHVNFEYTSESTLGLFWISIGDCFFLLKSDSQAEIIGRISPGLTFFIGASLDYFPRLLSIANTTESYSTISLYQAFNELKSFSWKIAHQFHLNLDEIKRSCFPYEQNIDIQNHPKNDELQISSFNHELNKQLRCTWFDISASVYGTIIWDELSHIILLTLIPKDKFSRIRRNPFLIPAVKTSSWGYRNRSAINTSLPSAFVTSCRNSLLVDVVPLVCKYKDYSDIHFFQCYLDHEIYLISYRWSNKNISEMSLPGDQNLDLFQQTLSAIPRLTYEIPFEGSKEWSFHSAYRLGLSRRNFKKNLSTISLFPWFKFFLLNSLGGAIDSSFNETRVLLSFYSEDVRNKFSELIKSSLISILNDSGFSTSNLYSVYELRQELVKNQLHKIPLDQKRVTFYLIASLLDENWSIYQSILSQCYKLDKKSILNIHEKLSPIYVLLQTENHFSQKPTHDVQSIDQVIDPIISVRNAFFKLLGIDLIASNYSISWLENCKDTSSTAISLASIINSLSYSFSLLSENISHNSSINELSFIQHELDDIWETQMDRLTPSHRLEKVHPNQPLIKLRNIFGRSSSYIFPGSKLFREFNLNLELAKADSQLSKNSLSQNSLFSSQENLAHPVLSSTLSNITSSHLYRQHPSSSQYTKPTLSNQFVSLSTVDSQLHQHSVLKPGVQKSYRSDAISKSRKSGFK